MLQTLFYIPVEVGGLPVFGFGWALALWAVICGATVAWLIRRHGPTREVAGALPMMAIVAAAIVWVLPAVSESRGLPIRGYGMMVLVAVVAAMALAIWRARRRGVEVEMILSLAFWMILPGIVGARLLYVGEYWSDKYWPVYEEKGLRALLGSLMNVAEGGLVVYGAFFGSMLGLMLFWRKYRIPLLATADLLAPSLLLGLALGRVGCLLNGCCYGGHCDLPWGVHFPWSSPVHYDEVLRGNEFIFGMKLKEDAAGRALVAAVEPGSIAEQSGIKVGEPVNAINGIPVASPGEAAQVLLGTDKLHLLIRGQGGKYISWAVDDPPAATDPADAASPRTLRIYGLEIAGTGNEAATIQRVTWQSAEARAGLEPGQWVTSINGRTVRSLDDVTRLLAEHRGAVWADITVGDAGRSNRTEGRTVTLSVERPLPRSLAVHPTQLYSTIDAVLLCLLLLAYDPFQRRTGELTAIMLTVYPITRFLIEMLRTDETGIWGTGLHISQNISLAILLFAVGLWIYLWRQGRGQRSQELGVRS